jgi:tyrosinase
MHIFFASIVLAFCSSHAAATDLQPDESVSRVLGVKAPALSMHSFDTPKYAVPLTLLDAVFGANASVTTIHGNHEKLKEMMPDLQLPNRRHAHPDAHKTHELNEELDKFEKRQSSCRNPRVRVEWDSLSDGDKQAFVNSVKCLMKKRPSGQFRGSQNRYEDMVALHQSVTPSVHGNAKFLIFHRYYIWVFEDMLRRECGFAAPLPWFDEPRYSGRFAQSSIFSDRWFGAMNIRGACVANGQFAYLACNIGPGSGNTRHCLSRNGDESKTANTKKSITDACNGRSSYADMASCAEGAAHAWGHNGIGAVMQDTFAAPSDPVFWLHHGYVDRNYLNWQNSDARTRTTSVSGSEANGRGLTLDTTISVGGIRPDVRIRDVLNTQGSLLCYRYNY